jgi:DNA modification methylase
VSRVTVHHGDNRDVLAKFADATFDACITDPPYALVSIGKRFGAENAAPSKEGATGAYARASRGFMGKTWDTGEVAFDPGFWREILRVLKPGAHLAAFGGTRSHHRLWCAIEDAGFEIRDSLAWIYGSGFPKSHDVSKAIDKHLGFEREKVRVDAADVRNRKATGAGCDGLEGATRPWIEAALERGYHEAASDEAAKWKGWGTALKPAIEPICLARKPLIGTVAANVLRHETGALNIDGTRIGTRMASTGEVASDNRAMSGANYGRVAVGQTVGRWPANVLHDGILTDEWGAYFYSAKAAEDDRLGSRHPTVKPTDLMAWLCRLLTAQGGHILDPFAGSGSTGMAAMREGFACTLIEREADYVADIKGRIAHVRGEDTPLFADTPPARIMLGVGCTDDSRPTNWPHRNEEMTL